MKGFPNQVADFGKIAIGMQCMVELVDHAADAKNDGVFGIELVKTGVAGTGHAKKGQAPKSISQYLKEQRQKPKSGQAYRATARGLRELYRLMGLIDDSGPEVIVTERGRQAAAFAGTQMDHAQTEFWRGVVRDIAHSGSHPYLVLLKLVARKPGITRAKCALALEAQDDSPEELDRVVKLADRSEQQILAKLGISKPNWDNAKKILPKFAEQLGDVISTGGTYVLADAPGRADAGPAFPAARSGRTGGVRTPRSSREVTASTIGRAGTGDRTDELPPPPPEMDPEAAARTNRLRGERLRRHNLIVQNVAARLAAARARLYEDPFDILALVGNAALLIEVKSLSGTAEDERDRVRDALSQLLYYEGFLTQSVVGEVPISKIACFEHQITNEHAAWLNRHGIAVIWTDGRRIAGDRLAKRFLRGLLEEFD
jgi:hypothetical protein